MSVWNQGFLQGDEANRWRISVRAKKVPTTGKQHKHLYFLVYWGLLRLSFQSNRIHWSRFPFMETLLILLLGSSCHNFPIFVFWVNIIVMGCWDGGAIILLLIMRSKCLIETEIVTRLGVQQCQAEELVFCPWLELICVRLTNQNFWLNGSRASFLVPSYSPSKSYGWLINFFLNMKDYPTSLISLSTWSIFWLDESRVSFWATFTISTF